MAEDGTGAIHARGLGRGWKISPSKRVAPGEILLLGDIAGAGAIQQIWITPANVRWRDLILRIYWDEQSVPSVESPLGDFFACGWGVAARSAWRSDGVQDGTARATESPPRAFPQAVRLLDGSGDANGTAALGQRTDAVECTPQVGELRRRRRGELGPAYDQRSREDAMNKRLAEFIGTFALVFFGCGAAVVGSMGSGPGAINLLIITTRRMTSGELLKYRYGLLMTRAYHGQRRREHLV